MTDARDKVLELLANKTITAREAETLLAAMQPASRPWWRLLLNPMEFRTPTAIAVSCVTALASLALNRFGVRFDGPLDAHIVPFVPSWPNAAAALTVDWLGLALVLFGAARLFARRGAWSELVLVVGVARVPVVLAGAVAALYAAAGGSLSPTSPAVLALALPLLLLVAWSVVLLVRGFATCTGLRGAKLLAVSLGTLLAAEIGLKLLLLGVGT